MTASVGCKGAPGEPCPERGGRGAGLWHHRSRPGGLVKEVTPAGDIKRQVWDEETSESSAARRGSLSLAGRGRAQPAASAPREATRAATAQTGWSFAG